MFNISAIYGGNNPPYRSWLEATDEKDNFEAWLRVHVPQLTLAGRARIPSPVSVLDLGCGWGNMSFRLLDVLRRQLDLDVIYTGVDPNADQLATFRRLADEQGVPNVTLAQSGVLEFQPPSDEKYDLVFVSHSLYYVADLDAALSHILNLGTEVIIAHHGDRGIHTVQQNFVDHVNPGPHIISTAHRVRQRLLNVMSVRDRRRVMWDSFESMVDVASCVKPESECGRNLLGFFLERPFGEIPPDVIDDMRAFITKTYKPLGYNMPHDDGIIIVS